MFISKRKYEEMKQELKDNEENLKELREINAEYNVGLKRTTEMLDKSKEDHKRETDKLKLEIEKLESENCYLKKYYKMDEEPSEDIIVKVRTNFRVHELEIENMELRLRQNDYVNTLKQQCYMSANNHFYSSYYPYQYPFPYPLDMHRGY